MAWGSLSVELLLLAAISLQLVMRRADPFWVLLRRRRSRPEAEAICNVCRGC